MKCEICKKEIRPGEHVYPTFGGVLHTKCGNGEFPAVMGIDGRLRWVNTQREVYKEK